MWALLMREVASTHHECKFCTSGESVKTIVAVPESRIPDSFTRPNSEFGVERIVCAGAVRQTNTHGGNVAPGRALPINKHRLAGNTQITELATIELIVSFLEAEMKDAFRQFSRIAADAVGSPGAFLLGVGATLVWAATGSYFHYSDTWQLVINTSTSIGTFLIVFLIQNTQNRDAKVMQLKLDELIRAVKPARTELVQMESLTDAQLDELQREFQAWRDEATNNLNRLAESRDRRIRSAPPVTEKEGPSGGHSE